MSDKDNGGDAFPTIKQFGESGEYWQEQVPGMTLRDYFAAKAIQGLVSGVFSAENVKNASGGPVTEADLVKQAYIFADAMIEERKK